MKRVRSQGAEEVYVLSAMLSLAGTLGWASFDGRFWSSHFYRTDLFGLVHVFTLGWLSLIIQGVLLRLAPMVLGTRTRSLRWLLVLAGLAAGVWDSLDDLSRIWKQRDDFAPAMAEDRRERLVCGWRSAVAKTLER